MRDIEKMADTAIEIIVECIGEENLQKIRRPISINSRAKRRWGCCTKSGNSYIIEISNRLLKDNVPDNMVMSILIHEILHSCKNGMSHKGSWKTYANKINSRYSEYQISRTISAASLNLEEEQRTIMRQYAIICKDCGNIHYSSKMSKSIKYPERYRCGICGGNMERYF